MKISFLMNKQQKNQFQLQKLLNQLLALSCENITSELFLKKTLSLILNQSIFLGFNKRGVIFIIQEPNYLKMVGHKNIEKDVVEKCKLAKLGTCACSVAAKQNKIHYSSCVAENHKNTNNKEGHYSIPIAYNNKVYAVVSLYMENTNQTNQQHLKVLKTIADTIGLVLHQKRNEQFNDFIKNKLDKSFGTQYFNLLAKFLTKKLSMKYCLIGQYDKTNDLVKTLVFVEGQKKQKRFSYSLKNTPCKTVIEKDVCVYKKNIQQLFPNDLDLVKLGVESYMGKLLKNEKGESIGLITLMHDKPIDNAEEKINILQLFLSRLSSECERKNLEDKAIERENKYKDIFENFQDVFVRATFQPNGDSIIAEVSPSVYKFSGYKAEELVGKPSSSFYQDVNQRNLMLEKLIKHKEVREYPLTMKRKNGVALYVLVNSQLITDKNNQILEVRSVVRDITENRTEELRKEVSYLIAKKSQRQLVNFNSLSEYVYLTLKSIIDTSNFYIALTNEENNTIDFVVFVDQKLTNYAFTHSSVMKRGLIECQLKGKGLFVQTEKQLSEIIKKHRLDYSDPLPKVMVTFPLKSDSRIAGVLTLKSYENEKAFNQQDIDLLEFLTTQLSNILERDKWHKSLIAKEKYFRELVEKSNEVTGIINDDGIIQYISESVFTILGYHSYEIIGKNFYDFVPDYLYSNVIDNFERFLQQKKSPTNYQIKLQTKNKQKRIIQFTVNNQLKNKQIGGLIFNAQDVTEKLENEKKLKKSQEDLIENEKNYKTIYHNANDGIIRFNSNFQIIDANKRMTNIIGFSIKELLQKTIFDLTLPEENDKVKQVIEKLIIRKTQQLFIEKKSIHKNGNLVACKVFIKPIYKANKNLDYFIAFITDVTKRNEAVLKAVELEKALSTSGNVLYVDINGNITYVSEKVCRNSGYTTKELLGKSIKIFNSGYHSKEYFKSLWNTILKGDVWSGEIRNRRKDGSFFWIFGTIIPIKDISGNITHFINVRQDITELKNARLNRVRDVIDAQEKEKENFAQELHDGLGQMLLASKMNFAALNDEILTLDQSTIDIYQNALQLLTESIQEARNVSHGLMSRTLVKFGLSKAIDNAINNIKQLNTSITIDFVSTVANKRYHEDIEKGLYRVVQELLSNLIKHSEATNAKIELKELNNFLKIIYTDNGVGICNKLLNPEKSFGIGLKNMETRVNFLMGSFLINEELTSGTEIKIEVPV